MALATQASCDYLAVLDATAPAQQFARVRAWMDKEPLPFFKALRERRPVLVTPVCTLVAGFDAVIDVLRQPRLFTTALYRPKMGEGVFFMCHDDDALHTREKSLMQAVLSRDDLPAVRSLVGRLSRAALDAATDRRLDAIGGYTRLVPARLVQEYFGLTGCGVQDLMEWSYWNQVDTFHNLPFDLLTDERRAQIVRRHDETGKELSKYIGELIVTRLATVELQMAAKPLFTLHRWLTRQADASNGTAGPELPDDIVARLLRSHFPGTFHFDIKRLGVNVGGLLIGAIETTSPAVAAVIGFFLERPQLLDRAIGCARLPDPGSFDAMVWEALRFVPISPYLFRETSATATLASGTLHATVVPPGTPVLALTQSAMFDARAFDNPDEYFPERNWYNSFQFGFGAHECLGRYIGMVMIPEMVRQILLYPGLAAEGPMEFGDGPFPQSWMLRWKGNPVEGNP